MSNVSYQNHKNLTLGHGKKQLSKHTKGRKMLRFVNVADNSVTYKLVEDTYIFAIARNIPSMSAIQALCALVNGETLTSPWVNDVTYRVNLVTVNVTP